MAAPHLILRTSWVYSSRGSKFLRTMRRLARECEELRVVADQHGAPTWARHVAQATAQVLVQLGLDRDCWQQHSGVYHLSSSGKTTWYDFAARIIEQQRRREELAVQRIVPIATADYPAAATRPAYSVLDTGKLRRVFRVQLPDWGAALEQLQEDLAQEPV